MKSIIPTVIAIISISLMTLIASCLIAFQLQITGARNFENNCVDRIQASNYEPEVIADCEKKATERGYTLTVQSDSLYANRTSVLVKLDYTATMPLFGIEKTSSIESFAK